MAAPFPVREGYATFRGHKDFYRIVGGGEEPGKLPLLCLHGGPGVPHPYLTPLERLAATGRRVIFYDQLGCGDSDHPSDPAMWTVDLFLEEVEVIREALGLDRIHLFGSSWGGMLAMRYALDQPAGLASLITAGSPASVPGWMVELARLRADLPPETEATLRKHEAAGTTDDPAYQEAMLVFYRKHVCRLEPWPDYVDRAFAETGQEVYNVMNGPSEFHVIGVIKDFDITTRLGEIRVPTLVTCGRHDEVTPATNEVVHRGIPGSEMVVFEQSSHLCFVEEQDRYLQVAGDFLARVEARL